MVGLKVLTSKFGKIPRLVFQSGKYFFITVFNVTRAKKTMAFYGWLGQIALLNFSLSLPIVNLYTGYMWDTALLI